MLLAIALAFLAACGFAGGNILIRIGTQYVPAPTATFFTVLVGAALVCGLAFAVNFEEIKALPPIAYAWIAVMGVLAYPVARVLHHSAIRMVGATRAMPMISLQPLLAFGIGFLILGERPNLLVTVGTPVIVGGLLLVMLPRRPRGDADRARPPIRKLGYLLAVGGGMAFVSRDAISRHAQSVLDLAPPFVLSGFALVIGGAILFAIIHRGVIGSIRSLPLRYVGICCLAGLLQGMAVAALFHALSRAPVTVVTPIYASQPLIALALATAFLRELEAVDWLLAAGTALSVAGVVLVILGAAG